MTNFSNFIVTCASIPTTAPKVRRLIEYSDPTATVERRSFTVPEGVTKLFIGALGAGGSGAAADYGPLGSSGQNGRATGGGGGAYADAIFPVSPGDVIEVLPGAGGLASNSTIVDTSLRNGKPGGDTFVKRNGFIILIAPGGDGGLSSAVQTSSSTGGSGGTVFTLPPKAPSDAVLITASNGGRGGNITGVRCGSGGGASGSPLGEGGRGGDIDPGAQVMPQTAASGGGGWALGDGGDILTWGTTIDTGGGAASGGGGINGVAGSWTDEFTGTGSKGIRGGSAFGANRDTIIQDVASQGGDFTGWNFGVEYPGYCFTPWWFGDERLEPTASTFGVSGVQPATPVSTAYYSPLIYSAPKGCGGILRIGYWSGFPGGGGAGLVFPYSTGGYGGFGAGGGGGAQGNILSNEPGGGGGYGGFGGGGGGAVSAIFGAQGLSDRDPGHGGYGGFGGGGGGAYSSSAFPGRVSVSGPGGSGYVFISWSEEGSV